MVRLIKEDLASYHRCRYGRHLPFSLGDENHLIRVSPGLESPEKLIERFARVLWTIES